MTLLTDEALEFARLHITKYYDSDFFPKPREFDALWHSWDDVKSELSTKNVQKLWTTPPRVFPVPKPSGDFRVVHQLEPLDAIVYTALSYEIAEAVEAARVPEVDKVACSYRLKPDNGNFFAGGSGYPDFTEKTEFLANQHQYVLVTDIADFYNQIYLHRLSNAVEYADASLKAVGDDIEKFITNLNAKSSQGIPVGPAASVVMAEAVLMDVDNFVINQAVPHTRYVDDFRIFGSSAEQLRRVQQDLTLYLYQNHRLTFNGAKTYIMNAKEYLKQKLHNPFAEEKIELFKSIEIFNPYTEDVTEFEIEVPGAKELLVNRLTHIINRILKYKKVDLGLARSAIRRARQYGVPDLAELIIPNLDLFAPVINDVALYLEEITNDEFIDQWREKFGELVTSNVLDAYIVRFWMGWYLAAHSGYLSEPKIRKFLYNTADFVNRAKAAITEGDLAWVRHQKAELHHLGSWERRALLDAARVLPSDERNHWLKLTEGSSPVLIDRWMAKWVRETA